MAFLVARIRALLLAAFAVALIVTAQPAPQTVEASSAADRVIAIAMSKLGAHWVWGAEGPYVFDCTGLVIYSFKRAGYYSRIGSGSVRSAAAFYSYFRSRGLTSRTGGRRGDLVVYGGGKHVGIYLGNGRVISTLTRGVSIHGLYAVTSGFTAFMHTGLSGYGGSTAGATGSTAKPKAKPAAKSSGKVVATRTVKAWRLNFRTGPSTRYTIKSVLKHGARVGVLASAHDAKGRTWYKVKTSTGRIGWIASWWTTATTSTRR